MRVGVYAVLLQCAGGIVALAGLCPGCGSGGDGNTIGAVCGRNSTTGSSSADACLAAYCCDSFNPCWDDAACAACMGGGGAECEANALYATFRACTDANQCFGGGGGTGGTGGGGAGGTAGDSGPDSSGSCDPAACLSGLTLYPPGCAEATCENDVCVVRGKDADQDGQRTKFCKDTSGKAQIETGNDCADDDPTRYQGAWDGPAGDGNPDRCDGIDQSCNGTADDDVLLDGTSCACKPGAIADCSETSSGAPLTWPNGAPAGECKYGAKTCVEDSATGGGKWGPCTGAVAPAQEECNAKDDDCDGQIDEDAANTIDWMCDADGDGHLPADPARQSACMKPTSGCAGAWVASGPKDDCDDTSAQRNPELPEVCDGIDNDCDGVVDNNPVNPIAWYKDADDDGHGDKSTAPVIACDMPASGWKSFNDLAGNVQDCNDSNPNVHPGLWDGPAKVTRAYGIAAPGWKAEIFPFPNRESPCETDAVCAAGKATAALSGSPVLTRTDAEINYAFDFAPPDPALGTLSNQVSIRWTGTLAPPQSGAYTFTTLTDDGVRLWVDGTTPLIDDWTLHGPATHQGTKTLQAGGTYAIKVEYMQNFGGARAQLWWQGPGLAAAGELVTVELHPVGGDAPGSCDGVNNDCSTNADDAVVTDELLPTLSYGCSSCNPVPVSTTESISRPCGTTNTTGICHPGVQLCGWAGVWTQGCASEQAPQTEACDQLDNDCNGVVDDNTSAVEWCYDGDGDHHGAPHQGEPGKQKVIQCADPDAAGQNFWVQSCDDCNDADGAVFPGATEICNGKDDDCAGGVDNNVPVGPTCSNGLMGECTLYGNQVCTSGSYQGCDAPAASPSAEQCDGKDNNCNGIIDDIAGKDSPCDRRGVGGSGLGRCGCGKWGCDGATAACLAGGLTADNNWHGDAFSCGGVFTTYDWDCDGSATGDYRWQPSILMPDLFCSTLATEASCNQGNWNNIGEFLINTNGGIWPPTCGSPARLQQCWWSSSSNSCKQGAYADDVYKCK